MNDTYVTFQGWVGNDVEVRQAGDAQVASFRVGVTPSRLRDGHWVDGETAWYTVKCWRAMAEHVARSVRKGDPVVVYGRLSVEVWHPDGGSPKTTWVVDARTVGHDLSRGVSSFTRPSRDDRSAA